MEKFSIAIVGATGLVGQKIMEVLAERKIMANYTLFSSAIEADTKINFMGQELLTKPIYAPKKHEFDFAFFAVDALVSKVWVPVFKKSGAIVIDNSNAFRRKKNVPLVVPGVNDEELKNHHGIIANPNCSTIQLVCALAPLRPLGLKKVLVSTYQAVSGAGKEAIADLENDTKNKFDYKIKDNLIPQIDVFLKNGYTLEEDKLVFESRKILGLNELNISATAVRIPLKNSHSESVFAVFEHKTSVKNLQKRLKNAKHIVLCDNPSQKIYPMPILSNNTDQVYVGRIRKDMNEKNSFWLFVVADNLRRGAAANTVDIFERLISL